MQPDNNQAFAMYYSNNSYDQGGRNPNSNANPSGYGGMANQGGQGYGGNQGGYNPNQGGPPSFNSYQAPMNPNSNYNTPYGNSQQSQNYMQSYQNNIVSRQKNWHFKILFLFDSS